MIKFKKPKHTSRTITTKRSQEVRSRDRTTRNLREMVEKLLPVLELLVEVLCLLVVVMIIKNRLGHHRLALLVILTIVVDLLLFSLSKVVVDKMESTLSRATLRLSKLINSLMVMANNLHIHRILAILKVTILKQLATKSKPTSKITNRGRIRCRPSIRIMLNKIRSRSTSSKSSR